jgi:glycosyltransferase involved in cell wall biosynthesis
MSAEVPVVASDVGGLPEVVEEGVVEVVELLDVVDVVEVVEVVDEVEVDDEGVITETEFELKFAT